MPLEPMDEESLDLVAQQVAVDTLVRMFKSKRWWRFTREDRHWVRVQINVIHSTTQKQMYRLRVKKGIPARPLPDRGFDPGPL